MRNKVILGTFLASSILLGGMVEVQAATSSVKAENKKITVTKDNAKLYKNSKLKQAKISKKGTVYQVDGYRNIDGKKYYRVYNTNSENQKTYKGYLRSSDATTLKAVAEDKNITYCDGEYTRWGNFYYTQKKGKLSDHQVYHVERSYTLGNGKKYYSLYRQENGKKKWLGYVNAQGANELKATASKKNICIKTDKKYTRWSNFYFNSNEVKGTTKKGQVYTAKRYYTLGNGKKYYSLYHLSKDGKLTWSGYVNMSATEDMKSISGVQEMKVSTANGTFYDVDAKKGSTKNYKGKQVIAKRYYIGEDGKKYYSIYDGKKWLGYLSENNLQSVKVNKSELEELIAKAKDVEKVKDSILKSGDLKNAYENATKIVKDKSATQRDVELAVQRLVDTLDQVTLKTDKANESIKKAEDALEKSHANESIKEEARRVIDDAKKQVADNILPNYKNIQEIPNKLEDIIKKLEDNSTTPSMLSIKKINIAIK